MLADRVLVQIPQSEGERRSRAGILIPATAQVSRRLTWAEVVAVGPHVRKGSKSFVGDCVVRASGIVSEPYHYRTRLLVVGKVVSEGADRGSSLNKCRSASLG